MNKGESDKIMCLLLVRSMNLSLISLVNQYSIDEYFAVTN